MPKNGHNCNRARYKRDPVHCYSDKRIDVRNVTSLRGLCQCANPFFPRLTIRSETYIMAEKRQIISITCHERKE